MNESGQMPTETDAGDNAAFLRSLYVDQGGVRGVFSSKVSDYVASRPPYPDALYEALHEIGALPAAPAEVADIGAGTGLFSAGLLARGHHVLAVEPNASMRMAAADMLGCYAGFRSIDGSAEATTLEDGSVDLITAAQAFHWFEVEAARRECWRILKPEGRVALIWNDRVLSDPLQGALEGIFAEFGGPTRDTLVTQERRSDVPRFFGAAEIATIDLPHVHALDRAGLRSLVFSRSYMPPRDSDAGRRATERTDAIFDAHAVAGLVALKYRTIANVGRPQLPAETSG